MFLSSREAPTVSATRLTVHRAFSSFPVLLRLWRRRYDSVSRRRSPNVTTLASSLRLRESSVGVLLRLRESVLKIMNCAFVVATLMLSLATLARFVSEGFSTFTLRNFL